MPVNASAVGKPLNEQSITVEKRRVLAFSAVIGATSPACFDDASPEGIVALPQYCVSLEWPLASDPKTAAGLGLVAGEAKAVIHLRQDSEFHSPIQPGDSLTIRSILTGVRSTARGAMVQSRTDTVNTSTRVPVVTTHSDALFMGVAVNGDDVSSEADSEPSLGDLPPSSEQTSLHIARELPHLYTECAHIWNPIHTERAAALAAGLPDIILHGTATWALAGHEIVNQYAGGDAGRLRRLAGEFSAMVIPGNDIVVEHARSNGDANRVLFAVRNHEGAIAIKNGVAELGSA
jgi:acyl dehydratase